MNSLKVLAAGSFRYVLPELLNAFKKQFPSIETQFSLGASGLLVERIEKGEEADILLSANKQWADKLKKDWDYPVKCIAYNDLIIVTTNKLAQSHKDVMSLLADPKVVLGNKEPKVDPCGQYAKEMFSVMEYQYPDVYRSLKDRIFIIGPDLMTKKLPVGVTLGKYLIETNQIQAIVLYGSAIRSGCLKGLAGMKLPTKLETVTADYAIARTEIGEKFLEFCLSEEGKSYFKKFGFLQSKI